MSNEEILEELSENAYNDMVAEKMYQEFMANQESYPETDEF